MLRLALAQVNPTVGDLEANAALVVGAARRAAEAGAALVALPEMVLTGYPVEDLALRASFQQASRARLAVLARELVDEGLGEIVVVLGYLDVRENEPDRLGRPRGGPTNAAAALHRGTVVARYDKQHLPNYGVFDETRYFVPGTEACTVEVAGTRVGLLICEDLWQDGPILATRDAGADVVLVINGSPYEREKDDIRLDLCVRRAREVGLPLAYVNLYGGQDELVFDGDSLVVDSAGRVLARSPQFTEDLLVVDLGALAHGDPPERLSDEAEVWAALTLGLGDYIRKNRFTSIVLGLSGGIDSAVVAALACDAIGAGNVHGVSMPSVYSSAHSRDDAADLAGRTGLHYRSVPIAGIVDAFLTALPLTGLAEENLQARVRGTTLMAISNLEGHLVLATGNKSELAVGYSTMYGDAVGGFAPIKDLAKTEVWRLARWRNAEAIRLGQTPPIPLSSIEKPPSAELRPDQLDTDSLPDYPLLDAVLDHYIERDIGGAELVRSGFDADLVRRVLHLTDHAEYKRRQYPPGTKISVRNFGRDRRLPITSHWSEVD